MPLEITFSRMGFANNSSSSHSLIFARGNPDDLERLNDGREEFGWEFFTLSTPLSKLRYFYSTLFYSLPERDKDDAEEKLKAWFIQHGFPEFLDLRENRIHLDDIAYGYVDHQSVMSFPTYRNPEKGIHIEFAKHWIREIMYGQYMVLGGNDNDEHDHKHAWRASASAVTVIYDQLRDAYEKILCVEDTKTGEFVLSAGKAGSLMKVKFNPALDKPKVIVEVH